MNNDKRNYTVYKITNKINDKIYIGCHVTNNIYDNYMGSGSNIKKAIDEFGKENFDKIILFNFDNKDDMLEKEANLVNREFIKRHDVYNIIIGGGSYNTIDTVTVKNANGCILQVNKNDPRYLSGELVGVVKGTVIVKNDGGESFRVALNDPRYLSGELTSIAKNTIGVKDRDGNITRVDVNDSRYLSGELVGTTKNMIVVRDETNIITLVDINDPRYLSGELSPIWTGKTHTKRTKNKMSEAKKGKYLGSENSQYGTCWIYNLELEENKKIKKEDLSIYLEENWIKGRKMNF